jgi:NodT family efflux transporter outer membrane factor (OMF) lipoprotein
MLTTLFRILLRQVLLPNVSRSGARTVAAVLSMAVAGCTVGPDFEVPKLPSVTRYTSPSEATVPGPDATKSVPAQAIAIGERVAANWWTLFRSSKLDLLVKQAIAGNLTLESAKARLAEAREAIAVATSALYPQIGLNAGVSEQKQSAETFGLTPNVAPLPSSFNLFQVGPTASYTPDLFGQTHRRIEQQVALAEYQSDQLDAAYLTLTGNTVSLALQAAAVRSQLKALNDILAIDRQNVELVRKQRQTGTVPDSDVIVAESQLASDETIQPGLEQQLSVAKHALAVLIGRAPGSWSPPDFDLAAFALPRRLPVSIPSELVHQRPDIQAAEAQLHAASAQIGIATAQLYPSITLSAGITASSLNGGELFSPGGLVWSIAAGLTQPIFDGGMREAERRAALAAFKESAADYQQTVLRAFGQVADILQALTHDTNLLAAQRHALSMASEAVRLQRINYGSGGSGIIGLLDAQRQYQQAQLGYVRAEAQRYQDTVQLLVAMGGGWWDQKLASRDNDSNLARNDPRPSQTPAVSQH